MRLPKKRWLMSLFVLIMGVSLVGAAYAATPQSWIDMMKNDPNPMYMNMNNNTSQSSSINKNTSTQQATQANQSTGSSQSAAPQDNSKKAPATQNDLYNQMLQLCRQVGQPMMQNCPMLNGSQLTREQMIKTCLGRYNQIINQPNSNISQQNWQAMQQICQQYYGKYYQNTQSASTVRYQNTNYQNGWNNMGGNWTNNRYYCGW